MSEIKKIVLDINGKEIELSLDEAKELQELLGDLFGEQKYISYPVYIQPTHQPIYPLTPWRQWETGYTVPTITSGATVTYSTTTGNTLDADFGTFTSE